MHDVRFASKVAGMARLRFANLMAPCNRGLYEAVAEACDADLVDIEDWRELPRFDGGFVCSPPVHWLAGAVRAVAAPVLDDDRFGGRPLHVSEVVVARDAAVATFAELRGCRWAVNEPASWSGYWVALRRAGEWSYFSEVAHAGSHQRAMRMVAGGEVDAAAIDCHVLARMRLLEPDLVERLRVIESLGPSPTQPFVVRSDGDPERLRDRVLATPAMPEFAVRGWAPAPDYGAVEAFARLS